mmetsp:Transcript_7121/g.18485  ORF Transcript_7121/g.18485 Transcript_7121/m.18485 type:complete len:260 (+) Transcript_7121:2276-3055(+)
MSGGRAAAMGWSCWHMEQRTCNSVSWHMASACARKRAWIQPGSRWPAASAPRTCVQSRRCSTGADTSPRLSAKGRTEASRLATGSFPERSSSSSRCSHSAPAALSSIGTRATSSSAASAVGSTTRSSTAPGTGGEAARTAASAWAAATARSCCSTSNDEARTIARTSSAIISSRAPQASAPWSSSRPDRLFNTAMRCTIRPRSKSNAKRSSSGMSSSTTRASISSEDAECCFKSSASRNVALPPNSASRSSPNIGELLS